MHHHPNSGGNRRKHSVPQHPNYMPIVNGVKGIQGSGATLNNPHLKRPLNNTVTIKTGLEVRTITE